MIKPPNSTSQSVVARVFDDAGLPVTGLVAATFPAVYYAVNRTAPVQVKYAGWSSGDALTDLALITSAWAQGGLKEIGGGRYRLDLPNAAYTTDNSEVEIYGEASGKRVLCEPIQVAYPETNVKQIEGADATDQIRDAAAAGVLSNTSNKLATDGTGRVTVGTNADKTGYSLATTPPTAAEVKTALEADGSKLDAIYDKLPTGTISDFDETTNNVTVGDYAAGKAPLQPSVAGRQLAVTAAGKAPATVAAGDIATDAIDAASLKADAVEKIAVGVEGNLIDEADGQTIINAIVGAIGNTNIDQVALVAAIRADAERVGGPIAVTKDNVVTILADYARRTNDYATSTNVSSAQSAIIAALPDISGLATTSQLNARTLLAANYATNADIQTLLTRVPALLPTKAQIDAQVTSILDAIAAITVDLTPEQIGELASEISAAIDIGLTAEEFDEILAQVRLIGSVDALVPTAITQSGRLVEVVVGADYLDADGTALSWTLVSAAIEANKADFDTVELIVGTTAYEGSWVDTTGGIVFKAELTAAQTGARTPASTNDYYIKATKANGHVLPSLYRGKWKWMRGE